MATSLPSFSELAGDVTPRLLEAARLASTVPIFQHREPEEAAKAALIGATDTAARGDALRWLEEQIGAAIAMAEMVEGPRVDTADTAEWDRAAGESIAHDLLPLHRFLAASPMARDPDWPASLYDMQRDLADPATRGDATRLLFDMWWRAMMTEQSTAREKPGAFLASVGIVAAHVDQVAGVPPLAEAVTIAPDTAPPEANPFEALDLTHLDGPALGLMVGLPEAVVAPDEPPAEGLLTLTNPSAEHEAVVSTPSGPIRLAPGGSVTVPLGSYTDPSVRLPKAPPLPGTLLGTPSAEELQEAFALLSGAELLANAETLMQALSISRSTLNNWRAARTAPRVSPPQARVLAAECQRMIADVEKAEGIFRRVVR